MELNNQPPDTTVRSVMGKSLFTVQPDATLAVADLAMMFAHSRHVPVVMDGVVLGILSMRDVLRAQLPSRKSTEEERRRHARAIFVRDVMTPQPHVVGPDDGIGAAARLCQRHHISSIPVVQRGELVGIVTTNDLVAHAAKLLVLEAEELHMTPSVARLMSPCPVTTIQDSEHLDIAGVLMRSGHFRHLPVMDGDRLVGIISDRDILAALTSNRSDKTAAERLLEKASIKASDVMTKSPTTISPEAPAVDAGRTLLQKKIGALVVLRSGRLAGIITEMDFVSYLVASGLNW
jgi:acetoin utilization protein AcuB